MRARDIAFGLAFAVLLSAPAYAQTPRAKASMLSEITGNFPNNNVGLITPATTVATLNDVVASYQQIPLVNNQGAVSTYTVALTDEGGLIIFNNNSVSPAVTLQSASTTGWFPFSFYVENFGSQAAVITPTAGQINNAGSYSVAQNASILIMSDGTNWQVVGAAGAAVSGCSVSGVTTGYVYNNGSSGCSTSTTLTTSAGTDTESGTLNVSGTFKAGGNVMTFPGATASLAALNVANQTVSGGAHVTSYNIGTLASQTYTINCGNAPLQYFTNNGSVTLAAPANDSSCTLKMTNGSSATAITWSGFTVGANIGDAYVTTSTQQWDLSILEIDGVATYFYKALQ